MMEMFSIQKVLLEIFTSNCRFSIHHQFSFFADNCWTVFRKLCFTTIYNPFSVLFVMICILLNTLCMALDHHDMSRELDGILRSANYVCFHCIELCFAFLFCVNSANFNSIFSLILLFSSFSCSYSQLKQF